MLQPEIDKNEMGQLALRTLADDKQFVRAVTHYADQHDVSASEDIFSKTGIKLVRKGTHLSGKFYERLVAHKLLKPIEQSLTATDILDASKIVLLAHAEARRVPSLAPLLENAELINRMQRLLGGLMIPAPLALKLSVMQVDRPKLFQHSLIVAMLSMVLAVRGHLSREESRALALASIFHDLGEACIDPDILAPQHRFSEDEHRHVYAHPITGYLMLHDFEEMPDEAAIAVLQHHERLDGSGYPYRLSGYRIGKVSRCLAITEFCASLLERYGADKRIKLKLWLNRNRYDEEAMKILLNLFSDTDCPPPEWPDEKLLMTHLSRIGKIFEDWVILRERFTPADVTAISYFIERANNLHLLLLESGFDQCRIDEIRSLSSFENPEICMEINVLLEELSWRFNELYGEVQRKIRIHGSTLEPSVRAIVHDWLMRACSFADSKH